MHNVVYASTTLHTHPASLPVPVPPNNLRALFTISHYSAVPLFLAISVSVLAHPSLALALTSLAPKPAY